jgi:CIC family chloride channel protein
VVDEHHRLLGVVTRRELEDQRIDAQLRVRELIKRPVAVVFESTSLREAADLMVREGVGRLPVVAKSDLTELRGILTRSDLLSAHGQRLDDDHHMHARTNFTVAAGWVAKAAKRDRQRA